MHKAFYSFIFVSLISLGVRAESYQISVSVDMNALADLNRLAAFDRQIWNTDNNWELLVLNENEGPTQLNLLGNLKLKKVLICLRNDSDTLISQLKSAPAGSGCEIKFMAQTVVELPEKNLNISLWLREADILFDDQMNVASVSLPEDEDFLLYKEAVTINRENVVSEIRRSIETREVEVTQRNSRSETVESVKSTDELRKVISSQQFQLVPYSIRIRRLKTTKDLNTLLEQPAPAKTR